MRRLARVMSVDDQIKRALLESNGALAVGKATG